MFQNFDGEGDEGREWEGGEMSPFSITLLSLSVFFRPLKQGGGQLEDTEDE